MILRTERYTEGVVADTDGTLFFSMTSLGTVSRFAPGATEAEIWSHVPDPNGHAIRPDGMHLVMSSTGAILELDPSGRIARVLATRVRERPLVYPNGVTIDTMHGGAYVTDSGYKTMPSEIPRDPQGCVYRVDEDGSVREVTCDLAYANGIALSQDAKQLFVGESLTSRIWSYAVRPDGSLGARSLFAEIASPSHERTVPDGITLAPDGRLYVAHYGAREVLVYTQTGELTARYDAGNKAVSHAAIGPDGTVFTSGGIESESGAGAIFAVIPESS